MIVLSERPRGRGWMNTTEPDVASVAVEWPAVHTLPVGDGFHHEYRGLLCGCGPRRERLVRADGGRCWLVVHEALDGRE